MDQSYLLIKTVSLSLNLVLIENLISSFILKNIKTKAVGNIKEILFW